jgi:ABC-type enterochelin transport system permease subunit
MNSVPRSRITRLWLIAFLPITACTVFLFVVILPDLKDPRFFQHRETKLAAVVIAGVAGAYGLVEVLACSIRRRTLLHPGVAFLALVVSLSVAITLVANSKQTAESKIIPELRLSSPEPSP